MKSIYIIVLIHIFFANILSAQNKGDITGRVVDEFSKLPIESAVIRIVGTEIKTGTDENGFFTTGDRAGLCGEDRFVLLGRSDGIVKVGGKRVDLDEVCDKIKALAGVRDAAAVAIPVAGGRETEIAVMVEGEVEPASIRHELAGVLEPYAVPRTIQVVAKMPATPAGKYHYTEIERLLRGRFLHIRKESSL